MASFGFGSGCLHSLVRRKPVDSSYNEPLGDRLARNLTAFHLVAIGVGSTIGAGVYVLVGTVARERAGIALILSFLIAGIGAALSAFCYAELASRCPSAGSAYHYSYICVGEGIAWLVGWALILEYTVCAAAIARGFSPNLVIFFGGKDNLPAFLIRQNVPGTDIVVDPCGAILCIIIAGILCLGIKESALTQTIVTTTNVCVMLFVVVAGSIIGFQTGWPGYKLHGRYLPHGINGVLSGAAIVFFSYIGFDAVAGTAEEVKDPQRNLPLGIGISLSLCSGLYMLVAAVIVGIVPYYAMDPDTPISTAFLEHGMPWAMYIVTSGAVAALLSTLLGSILPQPRILLSMARDGLLPSFFSDINENASVPVKSTLLTGFVAAVMAFCMEFSQLANMVNVGTLIALTVVAVSVLILRYVPPAKVPLLAPLHQSANYGSSSHSPQRSSGELSQASPITFTHNTSLDPREADDASMSKNGSIFQEFQPSEENENLLKSTESIEVPLWNPLILKDNHHDGKLKEQKRRRLAALSISFLCAGVLLVTFATSIELPLRWITWCMGAIGIFLLLWGLIVLSFIEQDEGRHSFGHAGGFTCPCVPALPAACILVNVYLMINLGARTWLQVSIWLLIGIAIYLFYGIKHSFLSKAMYAPIPQANKVVQSPTSALVLV